jgi:hypothetical protein
VSTPNLVVVASACAGTAKLICAVLSNRTPIAAILILAA